MTRNLLFITADQMRADCLSLLGHPCVQTPNLDRLAARGVHFSRHYTNAVPCGPSRACLHTSTYLRRHGLAANEMRIEPELVTLANQARQLGYDPALFGYTDVGIKGQGAKMLTGFREGVLLDDNFTLWRQFLKDQGHDLSNDWSAAFATKGEALTAPSVFPAEHCLTTFQTQGLLDFLTLQDKTPWFAHLSYAAPHPPFVVPTPYDTLYDPKDMPAPIRARSLDEEAALHPYSAHLLKAPQGWPNRINLPNQALQSLEIPDIKALRSVYFAMITELDHQVGRILEFLESRGDLAQTMIVFTADHGEMLGDHWFWAKYAFFEPSFHVPLIICSPDTSILTRDQRQVSCFTEHVDVMPTILEWLDPDNEKHLCKNGDGVSLLPFLRGVMPEDWRASAFSELDFRCLPESNSIVRDCGLTEAQARYAILRDDHFKLVHFPGFEPLLFDLKKDPQESRNLAKDTAYKKVLADYTAALKGRYNH
ncbi:MAG: sulfatase-like hydrolase/transferase [Pseudomonadota bacterium]